MRLLGCTETVTLVRHRQYPEGDFYGKEVIEHASWFEKSGSGLTAENGEAPYTEVTVRIPAENCPEELPKAGDYMVRGTIPSSPKSITPAALKEHDAFRIAAVGDNRRVCLPHVVVKSG